MSSILPFLSATCHSLSVAPREISFTIVPVAFVSVNSSTGVPSAVLPKSLTFTSAKPIDAIVESILNNRKVLVTSFAEWANLDRQPSSHNRMMQHSN